MLVILGTTSSVLPICQSRFLIFFVNRVSLKPFSKNSTIVGDMDAIRISISPRLSTKSFVEFSKHSMAIYMRHSRKRALLKCKLFFIMFLKPLSELAFFITTMPKKSLNQSFNLSKQVS